jgi:signal peptidase I
MKAAGEKNDLAQFRDTIESIYIAIVLAFVLRAFLVEAFVIPTGSMADSLYGEHYSLVCPACGYQYAYGAQRDPMTGSLPGGNGPVLPQGGYCPNCTYPYDGQGGPHGQRVYLRGGDRVLVQKYLYDVRPPRPWDVVVFKNPQNNRENYIKRLIGLPGETIQVIAGDIFFRTGPDGPWQIRRKPPWAQRELWQIIHDADYPPRLDVLDQADIDAPRWLAGPDGAPWDTTGCDGRIFAFTGSDTSARLTFDPGRRRFRPAGSYNAPANESNNMDREVDICTDWRLEGVLMKPRGASSLTMQFEIMDQRHRAVFDTAGQVRLEGQNRAGGPWSTWGQADVGPFPAERGRRIALVHVDYRLAVEVDGEEVLSVVPEQLGRPYDRAIRRATLRRQMRSNANALERLQIDLADASLSDDDRRALAAKLAEANATRDRLRQLWDWFQSPGVSIAATGEPMELRHVKLWRDVFYTCPVLKQAGDGAQFDYYRKLTASRQGKPAGPNRWVRDVNGEYLGWGTLGNPITLRAFPDDPARDEFFCLGDNSPLSHDGRCWKAAAPSLRLYDEEGNPQYQLGTVPRYNLLGRAMMVYWPAGYRLPILSLPIIPDAGRIRLVR